MNWDEVVVRLDGVELGRTDRQTLYNGGIDFALRDQTLLHLSLDKDPRGYPMIYATRNGMPLPGTGGDPVGQIQTAAAFMLLAGIPQGFIGLVIVLNDSSPQGMALIVAGVALTLLGLFSLMHSFAAMVIGSALFGVETLVLIAKTFSAAEAVNAFFLIMIVGWVMARGIKGAHFIDHMRLPVRRPPQPFRR